MSVGNKGGRPPKPVELHKRDGTYQPVRHAKRVPEAAYPPGVPAPPAHLNAEARKIYRQYGTLMVNARVLTEADASILALFAESHANWAHASRMEQRERKRQEQSEALWDLDEHDDEIAMIEKRVRRLEAKGIESVWYRRSLEERRMVEKFGGLLGLSPVMRGKVQQVEPETDKPTGLAEFLA